MPAININELRHVIPRYQGQVTEPDVLKCPDLAYLRLSASALKIMGRNGYVQRFGIVWIPTHFGKHRAIFVCSTRRGGAIRLFGRYGSYACCHCHNALYVSQKYDQSGRKRLAACKLRLALGGVPDIREPLPPKVKWKHKQRYQRLRNQVHSLEVQAKQTRFRKEIDIRAFAYHV
jgi:hypothetical protein